MGTPQESSGKIRVKSLKISITGPRIRGPSLRSTLMTPAVVRLDRSRIRNVDGRSAAGWTYPSRE